MSEVLAQLEKNGSSGGMIDTVKLLYTGTFPNGEVRAGNQTYTISEGLDSYKFVIVWANQGDAGKAIVRGLPILKTIDEFVSSPFTFSYAGYNMTVTRTNNTTITCVGTLLGAVIMLVK